jgi:hypothetical protein
MWTPLPLSPRKEGSKALLSTHCSYSKPAMAHHCLKDEIVSHPSSIQGFQGSGPNIFFHHCMLVIPFCQLPLSSLLLLVTSLSPAHFSWATTFPRTFPWASTHSSSSLTSPSPILELKDHTVVFMCHWPHTVFSLGSQRQSPKLYPT